MQAADLLETKASVVSIDYVTCPCIPIGRSLFHRRKLGSWEFRMGHLHLVPASPSHLPSLGAPLLTPHSLPPTLMIFILTTWQGVPWPNYCLETSEGGKHDAKCLMVKRFTSSSERRGILGCCWSWAGRRNWGLVLQQVYYVIGGQG